MFFFKELHISCTMAFIFSLFMIHFIFILISFAFYKIFLILRCTFSAMNHNFWYETFELSWDFWHNLCTLNEFHLVDQFFGWVWRPQTVRGPRGGHAHFPTKSDPENPNWKVSIITWISHHQSIDNSLLSYLKKFQSNWPKNCQVMAQIRRACPYLGIRVSAITQPFLGQLGWKLLWVLRRLLSIDK